MLVEAVETETLKEILYNVYLGGGFNHFLCSSLAGEMIQFDWYFSDGLKPPTRYTFPYFSRLLLDFGVDIGPPGLCWTLLVPIWPIVFWLERAGRMVEFGWSLEGSKKKNWPYKKSWEYGARFLSDVSIYIWNTSNNPPKKGPFTPIIQREVK